MRQDNQCSITNFDSAMKLLGDFWVLRIIDTIRSKELRFCEIERFIADISPATLTNRLKKLEEEDILVRRVETHDKQSVAYSLTERGQLVIPVLEAIKRFTNL